MNPKLTSILRETESFRMFTDDNYLATTHFIVFLLFGCGSEQQKTLEIMANKLIADRQAYALVCAGTGEEAETNVCRDIKTVTEKASEGHVDVDNLNELHICPVIMSESAEPSEYAAVIRAVHKYLERRDIKAEFKPFLILDTVNPNASVWLDALTESISELGSRYSCRCCILSRKNEKGFSVAEERLLTTVLFVAFLNAVRSAREEIGRIIGYQSDKPDELFYTAQTAFIENPVVTRIFTRMSGLLKLLCDRPVELRDIDMSFMQDVLRERYNKLPHNGGRISLIPLFSVMPGEMSDFNARLKQFAYRYYLQIFLNSAEKEKVFTNIASGFLRAYVKSGLGADELINIIDNEERIKRLCQVQTQGIVVEALPMHPGQGKLSPEFVERYEQCARWIANELLDSNRKLLEEFFRSEEFSKMPEKFLKVQELMENLRQEMRQIIRKRSMLETTLPLLNDPDESWIIAEYSKKTNVDEFFETFCTLALTDDESESDAVLSRMINRLYQISKGLSGGSDNRTYMKLISDTCADIDSDDAKKCIVKIGDALSFPARVDGGFRDSSSYAYVWSSDESKLYKAWKEYHSIINTQSYLLPFMSDERFAVLRVSVSFGRNEILSVNGEED